MADDIMLLRRALAGPLRKARLGALGWSLSYHLCLGLAGALGIAVTWLAKSDLPAWRGVEKDDLVALMSLAASILTFVGGFAGMERKWRANRRTRAELTMLRIELDRAAPPADPDRAQKRLFDILREHETGIGGRGTP